MGKNSKILITGATGLLGANLARKLVSDGYNVRILDRATSSSHPFLDNLKMERVVGDITDFNAISSVAQGIDYIFHCAGMISYLKKDKAKLYKINVEGTRNILELALKNGVKRVVHISSVSAINPKGNYGKSKEESEEICEKYIQSGVDVTIARPATIYGPGDINRNSIRPFKQILSSKFLLVPPGGKSYIHVSDLVNGIVTLTDKGLTGEKYIFSGENLTLVKLYNLIAKISNRKVRIFRIPKIIKYIAMIFSTLSEYDNESISVLFEEKFFSSEKTRKEIGWYPERNIEQAAREMIEFYKDWQFI